jgi:hypothetical protein
MDQPEQHEVTLGSFGELMLLIIAFTLILGFVAAIGTGVLALYGSRSEALSFAVTTIFIAAIAIYGCRELAVVTITEVGLRARHVFTTELVLWVDVLKVDYQAALPQLLITVRSQSKWFRGRNIRVLYRPPSKLGFDWREGVKQVFREVSGMQLPEEVAFLKDKVAAAQQLASRK